MEKKSQMTALRWWQSMNLPPAALAEKKIPVAPTAYKAQLRRCESSDAAMLTEGFRALWLKLDEDVITGPYAEREMEAWATVAAVLAHVKKDGVLGIAAQAGKKGDGDKSVVSELRFGQLQNAKTSGEFLRRMRRIVQQVKGEVSVERLIRDIRQWYFEHNQFRPMKAENRIAVKWAMEYYRAASSIKK